MLHVFTSWLAAWWKGLVLGSPSSHAPRLPLILTLSRLGFTTCLTYRSVFCLLVFVSLAPLHSRTVCSPPGAMRRPPSGSSAPLRYPYIDHLTNGWRHSERLTRTFRPGPISFRLPPIITPLAHAQSCSKTSTTGIILGPPPIICLRGCAVGLPEMRSALWLCLEDLRCGLAWRSSRKSKNRFLTIGPRYHPAQGNRRPPIPLIGSGWTGRGGRINTGAPEPQNQSFSSSRLGPQTTSDNSLNSLCSNPNPVICKLIITHSTRINIMSFNLRPFSGRLCGRTHYVPELI